MAKFISEKERRLQKKLIPVNIFTCILSLAAALSLFFAPFLKIDIGKILRSDAAAVLIEEKMDEMVKDNVDNSGEIDYAPVVAVVVENVLGSAQGGVSFSALNSLKYTFGKEDNKGEQVLEDFFYGEKGILTELIDSVADGVSKLLDKDENGDNKLYDELEKAIISVLVNQLVADLPEDAADKISASMSDLTAELKKFEGLSVDDEEAARNAANGFADKVASAIGEENVTQADKDKISDYIVDMYGTASEELANKQQDKVSVEALICVTLSKNFDLDSFNLGGMFGSGGGEKDAEPENGLKHSYAAADEEIAPDDETKDPDEGTQEPDDGTQEPDGGTQAPDGGIQEPDGEGGSEKVIYTSYSDMLVAMGLGGGNTDELKDNLKTSLRSVIDGAIGEYTEYLAYYGYVFYGMLAFIVPWLVLFLFAFIHTFTKNKRFMMWYVKLYSFVPCLVFFIAPLLAPEILPVVVAELAEQAALINAVFKGIGSFTWISGLCYLLLWIVSVSWAFPIKHKIRKERKYVKQALKDGTYDMNRPDDEEPNGKKGKSAKKNKKSLTGAEANGYDAPYDSGNSYGNPYNNNPYGNQPYGNPYDNPYGNSPYGGSPYGNPYGNPYNNPYGGNSYGNPYGGSYGSPSYGGGAYGGSGYDDDDGGFNDIYDGSLLDDYGSYGSSYYDDDDDDDDDGFGDYGY